MKKSASRQAGKPAREREGEWAILADAEEEEEKAWEAAKRDTRAEKARWGKMLKSGASISFKDENERGPRAKKLSELSDFGICLNVETLATEPEVARFVRRFVTATLDLPWPTAKNKRPIVEAEIRLTSYLTARTPKRLRVRTLRVRSVGDILVGAARMYARIYKADERLGGESFKMWEARIRREKADRRSKGALLNRLVGPYVRGHLIGDLVFEQLCVRWTGPRRCVVYLGIGS